MYVITKEPIAVQNEITKQNAYKKVFMDDKGNSLADQFKEVKFTAADGQILSENAGVYFESALEEAGYKSDVINGVAVAYNNGTEVGCVVTVTAKDGYAGDIKFTVGIASDGTVTGISMLSIGETAGLGMRAKDADFTGKFVNKNVDAFKVTKTDAVNDNEIDALSGSTITSKAVVNGVNSALTVYKNLDLKAGGAVVE